MSGLQPSVLSRTWIPPLSGGVYGKTQVMWPPGLRCDRSTPMHRLRITPYDHKRGWTAIATKRGQEPGCSDAGCIDGGYVRDWDEKKQQFEVIVGKSILAFRRDDEEDLPSSKCFGFVQTLDTKPKGACSR